MIFQSFSISLCKVLDGFFVETSSFSRGAGSPPPSVDVATGRFTAGQYSLEKDRPANQLFSHPPLFRLELFRS